MNKKDELLTFLSTNLFDPIFNSPYVSDELKYDFNYMFKTISKYSVEGIVIYFWTTLTNTELQLIFSHRLEEENILEFDSFFKEFKDYFTYEWLRR